MNAPVLFPMANGIQLSSNFQLPSLIVNEGEQTSKRFVEYFSANIRNKGTRQVYLHAVVEFFEWCDRSGVEFKAIEPIVIATYIESLCQTLAAPTVKVRLAAIKMLYDCFVTGQIVAFNPAAAVRGPKHVVKKGKTPVLSAELTRELLDSIDTSTIIGLRDRALIGVMVFSFARVSATLGLNVGDVYLQGRQLWFRFQEKGGKHHEVPAHRKAVEYLDDYMLAANVFEQRKQTPIFRTVNSRKILHDRRMSRTDALRMIKRRVSAIGLSSEICCHTWRATGITTYLQNGGTLEQAMRIACHASARTTALYDRTSDDMEIDEIERIRI